MSSILTAVAGDFRFCRGASQHIKHPHRSCGPRNCGGGVAEELDARRDVCHQLNVMMRGGVVFSA